MNISNVLQSGVSIGLKNFVSLVIACILYAITIWIPYLNVGTTIAMVSLPAALSRGEVISPTEIFDSKYRKNMGSFFILCVMMCMGVFIGYMFLIVPGIIISYSWSLALLLLVDKGLNPMQALNESNERTYGHKWTIFFTFLLLGIGYLIIYGLIGFVGTDAACMEEMAFVGPFAAASMCTAGWASFLQVILVLIYFPIQLGVQAKIYQELVGND